MALETMGWSPFFESQLEDHERRELIPARVSAVHRGMFRLVTGAGAGALELDAELRGKLRGKVSTATGDFVLASPPAEGGGRATIHRVLERKSKLSRKIAGRTTEEQVLAANIDSAWVVMALDGDFSLRRVERYLILIREGGARPVIVLSKVDLAGAELEHRISEVERVAGGARVYALSALSGAGLERLWEREITPGATIVLVGSSGVGKSTLTNRLAGTTVQETSAVRESDGKGRHTTTVRELLALPSGALLIDTPGLRELQLWEGDSGLDSTFGEVTAFARHCRFSDCTHEHEPGCAVLEALERGELAADRYESHRAMKKELAYLAVKQDVHAQAEQKRRWKVIHKAQRKNPKRRW